MSDASDNFGPWMEEQPSTCFCVCCFEEKTQYEIEHLLDEDDMDEFTRDKADAAKIEERNPLKLPFVICRDCMADDDDFFGGIPIDEEWP